MNLLLTIKEASERYGINENTVWGWLRGGKLSRHEIKGHIMVEDCEMSAMIEKQCPQCLERFRPATARQKYCSSYCRKKASREKSKRTH